MNGAVLSGLESISLKKRSDLHVARKVWHITTVSLMAAFYYVAPEWLAWTFLIVAWLIFVPSDFFRQKNAAFNQFVMHLFGPIMRQSEVDRFAGTTYLLTGVVTILLIFPKDIVFITLLFLAFADPIASYIGIRFGKDKIFGHKSLQGFLAAFAVCALICGIYFFQQADFSVDRILILALLGGLVGALAELIPVFNIDDNFTLPVLSASGLWVLMRLFGA